MGNNDDRYATPQHKMHLDSFSIDRYEVTNARYQIYINDVTIGGSSVCKAELAVSYTFSFIYFCQIYINDVTLGASTDYTAEVGSPQEDPELLLIEEMKKNQRRSSWCPEEERKKEDKSEKQRLLLGVCGRR